MDDDGDMDKVFDDFRPAWKVGQSSLKKAIADTEAVTPPRKFVIAKEVHGGGGNYYIYAAFPNERSIYDFIMKTLKKNRVFNEVIIENSPSLMHFDIEWEFQKDDKINYQVPEKKTYLKQFMIFIKDFLNEHYGLKEFTYRVLDGTIPNKKLSFHILINVAFPDLESRVKFKAHLQEEFNKAPSDTFQSLSGFPDNAIYTKNRIFRMANCNKFGKNNHLTYYVAEDDDFCKQWPENEKEMFYESLLTSKYNISKCIVLGQPIKELHKKRARTGQLIHRNVNCGESDQRPPNAEKIESFLNNECNLASHGTIKKWFNNEIYCYTAGSSENPRICPCGNRHTSKNNFHIIVDGDRLYYRCTFTKQSCYMKLQPFGVMPRSWRVPREEYEYSEDGKPRVRAFKISDEICAIVECTEMGGGKTFQTAKLIQGQFTRRDDEWENRMIASRSVIRDGFRRVFDCDAFANNNDFIGERVCIILPRIALVNSIMNDYMKDLDFVEYRDVHGPTIGGDRVVICLNSIWRIENEQFDMVIVDEIHECLHSLYTLNAKDQKKSKWSIFEKLKDIIQQSRYKLFLIRRVIVNFALTYRLLCQRRRHHFHFGRNLD
jgi:hypothetical protein